MQTDAGRPRGGGSAAHRDRRHGALLQGADRGPVGHPAPCRTRCAPPCAPPREDVPAEQLHAELAHPRPRHRGGAAPHRPAAHRAGAGGVRGDRPAARQLPGRARRARCSTPEQCVRVFLAPEREELYARIDARFDAMVSLGALEEVRALGRRGLDPALPAMRAHGVPWLLKALQRRDDAGRGHRARQGRHAALRQAAVHLVPAPGEWLDLGRRRGRARRRSDAGFGDG